MNHSLSKIVDDSPANVINKITKMSLNESNLLQLETNSDGDENTLHRESPPLVAPKLQPTLFSQIDVSEFQLSSQFESPVNVPERIILVVDSSSHGTTRPEDALKLLLDLKKALSIFVVNKCTINKDHEFAVFNLKDKICCKLADFNNVPKNIIQTINHISYSGPTHDEICILDNVFEALCNFIHVKRYQQEARPTRVIFLYSRFPSDIALNKESYFPKLIFENNVILDAFYIVTIKDFDINHIESSCSQFKQLNQSFQNLTVRGRLVCCYGNRVSNICDSISEFLPHPHQRSNEVNNDYSINQDFFTYMSKTWFKDNANLESLHTHM